MPIQHGEMAVNGWIGSAFAMGLTQCKRMSIHRKLSPAHLIVRLTVCKEQCIKPFSVKDFRCTFGHEDVTVAIVQSCVESLHVQKPCLLTQNFVSTGCHTTEVENCLLQPCQDLLHWTMLDP